MNSLFIDLTFVKLPLCHDVFLFWFSSIIMVIRIKFENSKLYRYPSFCNANCENGLAAHKFLDFAIETYKRHENFLNARSKQMYLNYL